MLSRRRLKSTIVAENAVVKDSFPQGCVVAAGVPAWIAGKFDPALAKDHRPLHRDHGYFRAKDFGAFKASDIKLK